MKIMMAALTVIGALSLACGEGDDASDDASDDVVSDVTTGIRSDNAGVAIVTDVNPGLDSHWSGIGLPVGDGTVLVSNETSAFLIFEQANLAQKTALWKQAFADHGWTVTDTFSNATSEAAIYGHDDRIMGWVIGQDEGGVMVYLEDLVKIPAEDSTVKAVKNGTQTLTRQTRPRTLRRGNTGTGGGTRALNRNGSTTETRDGGRKLNRNGGSGSGGSTGASTSDSSGGGSRKLGH